MWCTRWFLILFLLPYPRASPFFLVLFLFSLVLHSRPCLYCIVLLTALFTSSCYWAPGELPVPSFLAPDNHTTDAYNPHQRCWCDINDGHIFDPFPPWIPSNTSAASDGGARTKLANFDMEHQAHVSEPALATQSKIFGGRISALLHKTHDWCRRANPVDTGTSPEIAKQIDGNLQQGGPDADLPGTVWRYLRQDHRWPKRRYDLRKSGLDLIVDFAWGRTGDFPS